MQAIVRFGNRLHRRQALARRHFGKAIRLFAHQRQFRFIALRGCESAAVSLQQGAQIEHLAKIVPGPVDDQRTAVRVKFDEALGGQERERLAHRGAGHRGLAGDHEFTNPGARRKFPRQDGIPDDMAGHIDAAGPGG